MLLLGENARVKDIRSRGRAGDTDARSGPEPINFRAMDQSVIEELLHRFRPRIVINLTASCPTAVLPSPEGFASCGNWFRGSVSFRLLLLLLPPVTVCFQIYWEILNLTYCNLSLT